MNDTLLPVLLLVAGLVSLGGSVASWGWFWNHHKVRRLVSWIGVTATRVLYGVLGAFLVGLGSAALLGLIDLRR